MSRVFSSPSRVFGSSNAVRFVSADGAAYEPPVLYSPSDPPVLLQVSPPSFSSPLGVDSTTAVCMCAYVCTWLCLRFTTHLSPRAVNLLSCWCLVILFSAVRRQGNNSKCWCKLFCVCMTVGVQRSSPAREHSPWLRGGTSVGGESTSPGTVKRARSPGFLQRDSLKSRYSPGRPGSRRHQRWSNDQALREDLTDDDLRALYAMDWRSALSGKVAHIHGASLAPRQGRTAAEGFSPTSPRAHWIGPEQ